MAEGSYCCCCCCCCRERDRTDWYARWKYWRPARTGQDNASDTAGRQLAGSEPGVCHRTTKAVRQRGGCTKGFQQDLWYGPARSTGAPAFRLEEEPAREEKGVGRFTRVQRVIESVASRKDRKKARCNAMQSWSRKDKAETEKQRSEAKQSWISSVVNWGDEGTAPTGRRTKDDRNRKASGRRTREKQKHKQKYEYEQEYDYEYVNR